MTTTTAMLSHCTAQTGPTPAPSAPEHFSAPPEPVIRSGPEMLARWIAALRSGQYKQARNQLRDAPGNDMSNGGNGFCCLGVLADLAVKDGGPEWGVPDTRKTYLDFGPSLGRARERCSGMLPTHVWDWVSAGIDLRQSWLIDCNDDYGWSFERIADYIERKARKAGVLPGGGKRRA